MKKKHLRPTNPTCLGHNSIKDFLKLYLIFIGVAICTQFKQINLQKMAFSPIHFQHSRTYEDLTVHRDVGQNYESVSSRKYCLMKPQCALYTVYTLLRSILCTLHTQYDEIVSR